jgi:DNA-binding CsgD family transcriptional regulator
VSSPPRPRSELLRRALVWGPIGGVLLALLELLEYQQFVRSYPREIYGGLVAVIFSVVGLYLGLRWRRAQTVVVVREVQVPAPPLPAPGSGPFVADAARLEELGITRREHEILQLIAAGLSNREIGERVFISENTVKTHSSRLFEKLSVRRRMQAVQRARELRLIP